ncbi:MAG: DUF896 domain-containing protein [Clostridiales bacterium]|nr:DUF896 domain-containing protein [Clostridiales bacterium]
MDKTIKRINELAAIKKTRPLTNEEEAEKKELYAIYLKAIRGNLEAQLGQIHVLNDDGEEVPLKRKSTLKN